MIMIMTDNEAKELAVRTHKVIQENKGLKLLVDIAHKGSKLNHTEAGAYQQWLLMTFDMIGLNVSDFEKP